MGIIKQTKIAVLCGGISSEREISLASGTNCFNALKRLGYINTILLDIKSAGDLFNLKDKIEIAFLITHGKFGEDGAIQGVLEWLEIPYTGSSIIASAVAMDKWLTKQIARSIGLLTPDSFLVNKTNLTSLDLSKIWNKLSRNTGAVFLKPRDDGSSVNTFKIKDLKDLKDQIKDIDLLKQDYIIEEFILGREITVSLIETNLKLMVLPILELKPKGEFYDYHSKYTKGMTEFILPAKIEEKTCKKIEEDSINIFSTVGCSSFGRIDYILDDQNNFYLLEINSLPGMTDTSDLPAQAKCAGIEYDEVVEIILKTAKLHK